MADTNLPALGQGQSRARPRTGQRAPPVERGIGPRANHILDGKKRTQLHRRAFPLCWKISRLRSARCVKSPDRGRPSARIQVWLSFLCPLMPIGSMAGPSSVRIQSAGILCGAVHATTSSGGQALHLKGMLSRPIGLRIESGVQFQYSRNAALDFDGAGSEADDSCNHFEAACFCPNHPRRLSRGSHQVRFEDRNPSLLRMARIIAISRTGAIPSSDRKDVGRSKNISNFLGDYSATTLGRVHIIQY
jgi:hypothetical protein